MNIQSVNNKGNASFGGRIITKGQWTNGLSEYFKNNQEVQKLASGDYNIIAKMSKKISGTNDRNHAAGLPIYKLTLKAIPEKSSLWEKFKLLFGLSPKIKVTRHHHMEPSMKHLMDERINADKYTKLLGIG